jgi:pheromone shutdown-related protein TraB
MQIRDHNMVHHLIHKEKDILLVGTAHVSKSSAQLVATVIEEEMPDTVCVELCESRYQSIREKDRWRNTDIIKVIKEKKAFLLLSNLILSSFQKRIAKKFDINPGQEIIQAIETGKSVQANIYPVDRDIRITLSRTWRAMGLWNKIKLLFQLVLSIGEDTDLKEDDIERMKQEDVLESVLSELGKSLPTIQDTIIDERDQYLAQKIRTSSGNKIVAVVGAGHVPGIKRYFNKEIDLQALEELPAKKMVTIFFKWFLPVSIAVILVMGFFYGGAQTGADMVKWWIIANGILAGLGAVAAFAHPLTILSSMLAAPLTSLNPMIAAGWVSGLVEAFSRKPKVKDFENLPEDILSVKGFWKNKVTRILLVMVFTNLGSAIGTFVAIPLMARLL